MNPIATIGLLLFGAFLIGSIPFGFIAGRMKGIDLRERGSGNIGATNVLRVLGKGPGAAVLFLDVAKGFLPVWGARAVLPPASDSWVVGVGMAAILGHIYSPFVRFRGGKGVATALGVLLALAPAVAGLSFLAFAVTVALSRMVSLGSIAAALAMAILFWTLPYTLSYRLFATIISAFVIVRHRGNIKRILNGTESRIGTKKEP